MELYRRRLARRASQTSRNSLAINDMSCSRRGRARYGDRSPRSCVLPSVVVERHRIDFSRAATALTASSGNATSTSFLIDEQRSQARCMSATGWRGRSSGWNTVRNRHERDSPAARIDAHGWLGRGWPRSD